MLEQLIAELPRFEESSEPEAKIRSVLRLLLERPGTEVEPLPYDPHTCPNCGAEATSERSPYCNEHCRAEAAFVRQVRKAIAEGTIFDSERQKGIGQALWSLQGGGFPLRQTMVPKRVIEQVVAREGGVCSICGAPATQIDHTGSG